MVTALYILGLWLFLGFLIIWHAVATAVEEPQSYEPPPDGGGPGDGDNPPYPPSAPSGTPKAHATAWALFIL